MHLRLILLVLMLLGAICLADDAGDRNKIVGAWALDSGGGKTSWILEKTGDGLHFTYSKPEILRLKKAVLPASGSKAAR